MFRLTVTDLDTGKVQCEVDASAVCAGLTDKKGECTVLAAACSTPLEILLAIDAAETAVDELLGCVPGLRALYALRNHVKGSD